jgi:hypothetical protein
MMSDNDPDSTFETKQTAALSVDDVDIPMFPSVSDEEEDLLITQEMDKGSREGLIALEATARYDVPDDLLELATRSAELSVLKENAHAWREFVAIVDPRGRILLPSRVQQGLRGKKLRVKYLVEDDE